MSLVLDNSLHSDWSYFAYQSIQTGYPLTDVHVVTSKSHYNDLIHLAAVDSLIEEGEPLTMEAIIATAMKAADDVDIFTTEKVMVGADGITVFINAEYIDAAIVPSVCQMVSIALDELDGKFGEVEFSSPMQFVLPELQPTRH